MEKKINKFVESLCPDIFYQEVFDCEKDTLISSIEILIQAGFTFETATSFVKTIFYSGLNIGSE